MIIQGLGIEVLFYFIFHLQRGNIIRYNYIHHTLRLVPGADVRGIMLDDQYSSALIEKNVFFDVSYKHITLALTIAMSVPNSGEYFYMSSFKRADGRKTSSFNSAIEL